MNKQQEEIQKLLEQREAEISKELKSAYNGALEDIQDRIKMLKADEMTQSKIYQLAYQEQLEKQVSQALKSLEDNAGKVEAYLNGVFEDSYIGSRYALNGMGIGIVNGIPEKTVANTIFKTTGDFTFSQNLYSNVEALKTKVKAEIARGFSSGMTYQEIARQVGFQTEASYNQALRIARTEGHRVQSEARLDSMRAAKDRGADIVKVWDCTLDGKTRDTHVKADGQVRELDEQFDVGGYLCDGPGLTGVASEDIHCRCCVLEMPRWAVDDNKSRRDNETGEIIECKDYEDYKEKYNKANMSAPNDGDQIEWLPEGKYISRKEYEDIRTYANSFDIELSGFEMSDVDLALARETIDDCVKMLSMYPELRAGNGKFHLGLVEMHPDDLAESLKGHMINLNRDAYRNLDKLQSEYRKLASEGYFVIGSDYHHIIYHEFGHLAEDVYGIKSVNIVMEVTGTKTQKEMMKFLRTNLSKYAADDMKGEEIISEMNSAYMLMGEKPEFVLKFMEKVDKIKSGKE